MPGHISVTREQYLESIRQVSTSASDLIARHNLLQIVWQPKNGESWSMVECLDHLTVATETYLDSMEPAIMEARSGTPDAGVFRTAGWPSTKFVSDMEPPPRTKHSAPGKIRPRPTLNPEGILPRFLAITNRVAALVTNTPNKDLNSVRFRNPFIPVIRFTVSSGFLILGAHFRRHIWQAEQVAQQPDFPH